MSDGSMISREEQMVRASDFVRQIFGKAPHAVLTDSDGEGGFAVYSNMPLNGSRPVGAAYVSQVKGISGMDDLRYFLAAESSVRRPYTLHRGERVKTQLTWVEAQLGLDRYLDECYSRVSTRKIFFEEEGYMPVLDFPEETVLVHEMTHPMLDGSKLNSWDHPILNEALATLMERDSVELWYPADLQRWDESRRDILQKVDSKHRIAIGSVLDPERRQMFRGILEAGKK